MNTPLKKGLECPCLRFSNIYIYIFIHFFLEVIYLHDMGKSSTANRRSYFKMSNLLKQQWVRASFVAQMRDGIKPISSNSSPSPRYKT